MRNGKNASACHCGCNRTISPRWRCSWPPMTVRPAPTSNISSTPAGSDRMKRAVDPACAVLGEGPLWVAEQNALYWVDIKGQRLHRYRVTDGTIARWDM